MESYEQLVKDIICLPCGCEAEQYTPASSSWPQLPDPRVYKHSLILISLPVHLTSNNMMVPLPSPYTAHALTAAVVLRSYPSWRQTTLASLSSQPCLQTVPQMSFLFTSTLPSLSFAPPTNRTAKR